MKKQNVLSICGTAAVAAALVSACNLKVDITVTATGDEDILTYVGRTDRTQPNCTRQYGAGCYMTFAMNGNACDIYVTDENLYGTSYNMFEVVVDGKPTERVRTVGHKNVIVIGQPVNAIDPSDTTVNVIRILPGLAEGRHEIMLVRDTENQMGYTQIDSVAAKGMQKWTPATDLRIEFIGNSITSGYGCYPAQEPVDSAKMVWYDRHGAYYAYGPRTARNLNAQWSLASVSGISLIHSCCDHPFVMPQNYEKINMTDGRIDYPFDFNPDIVCSALGQNDGVQDSAEFVNAYVDFLKNVKRCNPKAQLALLSSPMADDTLRDFFKMVLPVISERCEAEGLGQVPYFFFEKSYTAGKDYHPSLEEQEEIANLVTEFFKKDVLTKLKK